MSGHMLLQKISDSGAEVIATLQSGEVVVGREPDEGIAIPHGSISRNHGVFVRIRNHWLYQDLGSTNGSWVDGQQAQHGVWKIVRPGSIVQMADIALKLVPENAQSAARPFPGMDGRSLLVFANGQFYDELQVPDFGRVLSVGGTTGTLQIQGDLLEEPSLIVTRHGNGVAIESLNSDLRVAVNSQPATVGQPVVDGDSITIAEYLIIYNDPPGASIGGAGVSSRGWEQGGPDLSAAGAGASRVARSSVFGMPQDNLQGAEETMSIDASDLGGSSVRGGTHPSMRYTMDSPYGPGGGQDDFLWLILVVLLSVLLAGLVIWWFLVA